MGPNDYRQKAKTEIKEGTRVAFYMDGLKGLIKGTATDIRDWGIRVTIDNSSFNVPVEWDHLHWWASKHKSV